MINLDPEILNKEDVSPNVYSILACLYHGKNPKEVFKVIPDGTYITVETSGYVRENPTSQSSYPYALTGKGMSLFEDTSPFATFVEEYRNLFPKGVKSGNGTPIRGDKQGVSKKMEWFLRTYTEYSKSTILAATKLYVEQMQRKAYAYMTQADYLINKDGVSKLAALCEDFDNKTAHMIKSGERRL